MKLLHLADLHLGKSVHEMNLLDNQAYVLNQVLDVIKKEPIDGLLLAGDIYDRSIPSSEAVLLFDDFLTQVVKEKVPVFIIAGNHDSGERLNFAKELLEKEHVYIAGTLTKDIKVVPIEKHGETVYIHMLPFFKVPQVKVLFQKEIKSFEEGMKVVLEHHKLPTDGKNILLTHQFIAGIQPIEESDSEQDLSVGGTDAISYQLFSAYDYVALGHIHGPQKVGRDTIRYSGSLLKYSFSEEFHKKSMTVVTIEDEIKITTIPLQPLYDMRKIKGRLQDLISPEVLSKANVNDYISATLTDEEELVDPMGKLRNFYPNIMELIIEKNQKKGEGPMEYQSIKEKQPLELFDSFLEVTTGKTEERRHEFMQALLEEVGEIS